MGISYLFTDKRMLLGHGILESTDIIFKNFTFITTKLPWHRFARLVVAQGECGETKGRHGILRTALR